MSENQIPHQRPTKMEQLFAASKLSMRERLAIKWFEPPGYITSDVERPSEVVDRLLAIVTAERAAAFAECREMAAKLAESYGYKCRVEVIDAIRALEPAPTLERTP